MMRRFPNQHGQRGVALLEAIIAAVILATGLIGALGLQARSYSALNEAGMRAEATIAASELLGVINSDLANKDAYKLAAGGQPGERLRPWFDNVSAHLPNATAVVNVTPASGTKRSAVDISIGWRRSADLPLNQHRIVSYLSESR